MKMINDPCCTLCNLKAEGTYLHMFWNCPPVKAFWETVAADLSDMFEITVPCSPITLLLIDLSQLGLNSLKSRLFLAGLTAAKKLVATRWKPPHTLARRAWVLMFLDIVYLELSTARVHGAKESTVEMWSSFAENLKNLI